MSKDTNPPTKREQRGTKCLGCNGTGEAAGVKCPTCNGTGRQ